MPAPTDQTHQQPDVQPLGDYLRESRLATGLTLRQVEARTEKAVTNGYLSQIEKNTIRRPSPNVLFKLAEVYGLDYSDLLRRAGHHVPATKPTRSSTKQDSEMLAGIPLRAIEELTAEERRELTQYIAFLRQRRQRKDDNP